MGNFLACMRTLTAHGAQAYHTHISEGPTDPAGSHEFADDGLISRTRLGALHRMPTGFEDASDLLRRMPPTFRAQRHRLELQPGGVAHRALLAALADFGDHDIDESLLRAMILKGTRPDLLPALEVLLHYRLLDFALLHEHDAHCGLGPLGQPRHCTLIHRMALASADGTHRQHTSTLDARFSMLKSAGVALNTPCAHGETPLMWAARWGSTPAAAALVNNGADIHKCNHYGYTALHMAAESGRPEALRLLVNAGVSPDIRTQDHQQWTPLHVAAANGQRQVIAILSQLGANMNPGAADGATPLLLAVRKRKPLTMRALAKHGAVVNIAHGREQYTALHYATRLGALNEVIALLESGANTNARARGGFRPLHLAGSRDCSVATQVEIATTLLDYGALIDARAENGQRPIDVVGEEGNEHVFRLLVNRGAARPHRLNLTVADP